MAIIIKNILNEAETPLILEELDSSIVESLSELNEAEFLEALNMINDENILEALGNLKDDDKDGSQTMKRLLKYSRAASHVAIGSKSKVGEKEDSSTANINKHVSSLGIRQNDKESSHTDHVATLVHVNGMPHSLITSGSIATVDKTGGSRRFNRDVGPNEPSVNREGDVRPSVVKSHIQGLVDKHGADNVKLQKVGSDSTRKYKSGFHHDDSSDLDKIRAKVASKYVDSKIKDNSEAKAKHLAAAKDVLDQIHTKIKEGKDGSHLTKHFDELKKIAELHSKSTEGTTSSKYGGGREDSIKTAKDKLSFGDDRQAGLKSAKAYIKKANESETFSIKQILSEAVSPFKAEERVHVGGHALHMPNEGRGAELGTVTKTNGHGHTFVKTDSGKEHVFSSDKKYRGSVINGKQHVDDSMSHLRVHPIAEHEAFVEKQKQALASHAVKKAAEEKHKSEQITQHAPVHKEILNKLKNGVGDEHLKHLGEQVHEFDHHGAYHGSTAESEIKDHPFKDLFHKITKNVRITNASPEHTAGTGVTHHGSVNYRYEHPGGGSNGHTAYEFSRHMDGHIEVRKHVHNPGDGTPYSDHWERKVTHNIK